jgi:hypothetical protein
MDDAAKRPLRQLAADLSVDLRLLGLQLAGVARAESRTALAIVTTSLIGLVAGAVVAVAGMWVLTAAVVLGVIAAGLPPWAAALIVGVVFIAAGGGAAYVYLGRLRHAPLALPETRASLTETLTWLKSQTGR